MVVTCIISSSSEERKVVVTCIIFSIKEGAGWWSPVLYLLAVRREKVVVT